MNKSSSSYIIPADFPDPDVIRVDDTYYMVSTTMHFMPGCVILRSHNLVDWEHAAYVYDELEHTEQETDSPRLTLKATFNLEHENESVQFAYSDFNMDKTKGATDFGPPIKLRYTLDQFVGVRFALFHYSQRTPGGTSAFKNFNMLLSD